MDVTKYKQSKTTDFFYKINLIVYLCGFPNCWVEKFRLPEKFIKVFDVLNVVFRILIYALILFQWAAYFTQHNLREKHKSNLMLFSISHPLLIMFRDMLSHNAKEISQLFYNLTIVLKKLYSDPKVEDQMIKSTIIYVTALCCSSIGSVIMMSSEAIWDVARHNATFTTVITAYPDVDDRSCFAKVTRITCYVVWLIFCTRVIGTYMLVIPITTSLGYQFNNLQSYFKSLNDIFERNDLQQENMEYLYEEKFKVGIKMHCDTLRCRDQAQRVCSAIFSGQIVFNVLLLVVLMAQMASSERTLLNVVTAGTTAVAILISTGFLMWNSGDVTIEASELGPAIFYSGWHNCMGRSSIRIRKMVMVTMINVQRPVILKALGYIDLSYQSYIKIVKASYSVFSVIF